MNILVVPSNREESIYKFIEHWDTCKDWDKLIVVEDNPKKTFNLNDEIAHFSWEEIQDDLKENSWIISKKDSAIRSYGFLKAYQLGAEYIFTLDDDCYQHQLPFCKMHIDNLKVKKWNQILEFHTRGIPYKNLGELEIGANMGLWSGWPDQDAIHALSQPIYPYLPSIVQQIVPNGQYFPMCGMNLCFRAKYASLFYFPLMGLDSPYNRFDDIWCGIIVKKIFDHLKINVSYGYPYINHQKASNPFVNLKKEAPGIEVNEIFWEKIDNIKLSYHTPQTCMKNLGTCLQKDDDEYLSKLGKAIEIWSNYFV